MARKILFILLSLSLIIELAITAGSFFAMDFTLSLFKVSHSEDTAFLAFVVGWLCLFTSSIICIAIWKLYKNQTDYMILCYALGFFWIAIGIAIYFAFKRPDNLWIDSLKGLLLIITTRLSIQRAQ